MIKIFLPIEKSFALATVTKGTGGTISADKATNATIPAYTTLGNIKITEGAITDFSIGTNLTFTLNTPAGWTFNTAAIVTSTFTAGRDITAATVLSKTTTVITIQITVGAQAKTDVLTIGGVQVRSDDGANVPGTTMLTRGGTAFILGCASGADLADLSQTVGVVKQLVITLPGQSYTDGTTLAGSGITGTATSQVSATSFVMTKITAADQFFNIVTSYTGVKTLTYSGPSNALTAPTYTTAVTFASGLSTTALTTTLKKAETTTITVTDGTVSGLISSSLIVYPAVLSNFLVEAFAGGNIGPQLAGSVFNIRITARDANNNTCNNGPNVFSGTTDITSTGILSTGSGTTPAFSSGVLASTGITISNTGTFTLTATNTIGAQTGISNSFTVNPGALNNFLLEAAAGGNIGSQIAGSSFNIKITARDANNNICNSGPNMFSGTADISSSGNLIAGSGTTAAFTLGILASKSVTVSNTGSFTITATKTSGLEIGFSNIFSVNAAVLNNFLVEAQTGGSIGTQIINEPFNIKISARDIYNNICNSGPNVFSGTVDITSTGTLTSGGGTTPAFLAGVLSPLSIVISNTGNFTITATKTSGIESGISNSFNVNNPIPNLTSISPQCVSSGGTSFSLTVNGSNFISTSVVRINGSNRTTIFVSSTQILATITSSDISTDGIFNIDVKNLLPGGGNSGTAPLAVNLLPVINSQPSLQNICNGSSAIFSVSATGFNMTYQWKKNGVSLVNGANISGAISSTLTINPASFADTSSFYSVSISSPCNPDLNSNLISLLVKANTSNTANISICSGQSYTPPGGSTQTTTGVYVTHIPNTAGCDSTITTNLTVVPNTSSSANISICNGQSYTPPGGSAQTTAGVYMTHIPNAAGCDSTITTNLTVVPNTSGTTNITICNGQSYTPPGGSAQTTTGVYLTHIPNAAGCDSTITTNLTVIPNTASVENISICNGQSYTPPGGSAQTATGSYITYIPNAAGCDSTITTNLTVIPNTSSSANISICNGQSYTPPGGSAQTTTGVYVTHIPNAAGCDSTITTNLTVIPNTSSSANISICNGQSYTPPGGSAQTTSGSYITHIPNAAGCDSTITTNLTVIPNTSGTANISICNGQSYTPQGGSAQTTTGSYITHIPNAAGCDSTITTNLTVIPNTSGTANISICNGQSYTPPGGSAQTTTGVYVTHITNAAGCDSTITTNLTVIPNTASVANISICNGQSYTPPGGSAQTTTGSYITHISNATGCDSTITTNLTIIPNTSGTANISICNGQSYTPPGGSAQTATGVYVTHIQNAAGCDSVITTNLNVILNTSSTANVSICTGQSYTPPGGTSKTTSGTYITHLTNTAGCDSTITTNLTVYPTTSSTANIVICNGQSYTPPGGSPVTAAGTYVTHIPNAHGCDSTITTILSLGNGSSSSANVSICSGQSYTPPGGSPVSIPGTFVTHIANANGCDSTITTNLSVKSNTSSVANVLICHGQSYTPPGGSAQTTSGTYVTHIVNSAGCDSMITTNLTVTTINSTTNISACKGDTVNLPDNTFIIADTTTDYIVTIPRVGLPGCDSIITTRITVIPSPILLSTTNQIVCHGNLGSVSLDAINGTPPYSFSGSATSNLTPGNYTYRVTDSNGCSSSKSVTINSEPSVLSLETSIEQIKCYGGSGKVNLNGRGGRPPYVYSGDNTTNLIQGNYNFIVTDANGCTAQASAVISSEPPQLAISPTVQQIACFGGKGNVTLSASGGTPGYTYASTPKVNLSAGTYNYTVTDTKGCTSSASVFIAPAPSRLVGATTSTLTRCDSNSGSASVNTSGGSAPYTYSWQTSPLQITQRATGLATGTYVVNITDGHGCTATAQVLIKKATPTPITITGKNSVCPGELTSLCATSGLATYLWNNGDTTKCTSVNTSGTYSLTAINLNGCSSTASKVISNGTTPRVFINGDNYICPGSTISLCASSGMSTYVWNTSARTQCIPVRVGGNYTVTATNSTGCTASESYLVRSPMFVKAEKENGSCSNGFVGKASVTVVGQTGPYSYLWNNGEISKNITELQAGTYIVTVSDNYGCTATSSTAVAINKLTTDYSTINSSFNNYEIPSNNYIWFNSSVKVNYTGPYPVTVLFTNQVISSSKFNITPPNAKLILTNSVSQATTTFNGTEWVTTAPPNPTGQYFISGYAHPVSLAITPNLIPVSWKGIWSATCPGISFVDWKWSAAVYSNFMTDLDSLGIKPVDDNITSQYNNTDLAGTPENFKSSCIIGAKSLGGNNYTGTYTNVVHRKPCAPLTCLSNSGNSVIRLKSETENGETIISNFYYNAYPNPFSSKVTIDFERSDKSCNTLIEIYNFSGQKVSSIFNNTIEPGIKYTTEFDAGSLPEGLYICKIISGDEIINKKFIYRK